MRIATSSTQSSYHTSINLALVSRINLLALQTIQSQKRVYQVLHVTRLLLSWPGSLVTQLLLSWPGLHMRLDYFTESSLPPSVSLSLSHCRSNICNKHRSWFSCLEYCSIFSFCTYVHEILKPDHSGCCKSNTFGVDVVIVTSLPSMSLW